MHAVARPGPVAPLRYELFRLCSVRITWIAIAACIATALCTALVLARTGIGLPSASGSSVEPSVRLLTGWPSGSAFLLPPAAVAVGLLGALAFGEEFRYPALAPARSPVPRRISLLAAKLAVSGALAVVLSLVVAAVNAATLSVLFGGDVFASPAGSFSSSAGGAPWELHFMAMLALTVGCGWAGVLAGGHLPVGDSRHGCGGGCAVADRPSRTDVAGRSHRPVPRRAAPTAGVRAARAVAAGGRALGLGRFPPRVPTRRPRTGVVPGGAALRLPHHGSTQQSAVNQGGSRRRLMSYPPAANTPHMTGR